MIDNWFHMLAAQSTFVIPEGTPTLTLLATKVLAAYDGNDADFDGWFGRCSVVVRKDKVVVLTYREGSRHQTEEYGIVHIRFSDDYGATWSAQDTYLDAAPIVGFPMRPTGAGNPSGNARGPSHGLLTLCPNDDLVCQMWDSDYQADNMGSQQARSTDGGLTWDTPAHITVDDYPGQVSTTFFGEGRTIVDDVIYAIIRDYRTGSPYSEAQYVAKSSDNALSWQYVSQITDLNEPVQYGISECSLEYLGEGRFITLMRPAGSFANGWLSHSSDYCATWSECTEVTGRLNMPSNHLLGRTQIKTRAHVQLRNNWWRDRVILVCGYTSVDGASTGTRRNTCWVGVIPEDYNLENIVYSEPMYPDLAGYDGGYGDFFYNPLLDQYVYCSYRAPTSYYDGSVKQYNFKLSWI